jgi:hypothetical protein
MRTLVAAELGRLLRLVSVRLRGCLLDLLGRALDLAAHDPADQAQIPA